MATMVAIILKSECEDVLTVVIAEKPSVARDLSSFLQAKKKCDGYFEGNGFQVTWAFGHLVTLKEPQEYSPHWKRWTTDSLPIIPGNFELKCREDAGSRKQLEIIWNLLKKAQRIICATDAGREGELIFRNILRILKMEDKPFERLWLSSLTDESIRDAFDQIKAGSHYDNLYQSARCRSESDWIVGINGTRNLTVRYGQNMLWSMGRVQTPVLALLADRNDEISTFVSEPFWELYTRYRDVLFKYTGKRFSAKEDAEKLLEQVREKEFCVDEIVRKREKAQAPLLFDLTELQREMNRLYGLSAQDTLESAQSLYESKYITYPRTDSQYLSKDMKPKIVETLNKLKDRWPQQIAPLSLNALKFTKRIINDEKVSDHHAIIPTGRLPSQLPLDQQRILEAVVLRLIAAFYPSCEKDVTTVEGSCGKTGFKTRGVIVVEPGWTALYQNQKRDKEKESDEDNILPEFSKGESGPHDPLVKEGKTNPPKPYTENSLLAAMATAGKQVDDEELKEALKERGLGTPATRASIIETLIGRGYVKRSKKTLTITPLGRYLIALIQDPQLKSPELTGNWEAKLRKIEKGALDPSLFMQEIVAFTRGILESSDLGRVDSQVIGPCPLCQHPVIRGKKGYGCSRWKEGCGFVIWPEYKEIPLNVFQIQRLLQHKVLLSPLVLKEGDKVVLALTAKGRVIELPVPKPPERKSQKAKS